MMASSSSIGNLLFVYGTLRRDANRIVHSMLAPHSTYVGEGRIHAELYDLGSYPGASLREPCPDIVVGEVYALDSAHASRTWQVLDKYEGCGPDETEPTPYRRQKVNVFLNDGNQLVAWAYVLTAVPAQAVRIPSGDYGTGSN